jgi:hypothetical protein
MKFYWNDEVPYPIDPNKFYLIYYVGCFCPPHKSHFSIVEKFASYPNVRILISQYGKESRHNVPFHVSQSIWKTYLKTFSHEQQKRIVLEKLKSTMDVKRHMKNVDVIVYMKGNEENHLKQARTIENDHLFKSFERKFIKERHRLIKIARKHKADVDFCLGKRNGVSATEFVKALKRNDDIEYLRTFMPDKLPLRHAKRIVRTLQKFDLKVEK